MSHTTMQPQLSALMVAVAASMRAPAPAAAAGGHSEMKSTAGMEFDSRIHDGMASGVQPRESGDASVRDSAQIAKFRSRPEDSSG